MNKELFVSATPHEIKVGMVEDDQLAEVYLERENEYTLAGSIYKGRVTRVLPGMQSAFVDIGLERDAFLYVSDFMELENEDGDMEEIPASAVGDFSQPTASQPAAAAEFQGEVQAVPYAAPATESRSSEPRESSGGQEREGGRDRFRGRRRRGRRDGGSERSSERSPERVQERSPGDGLRNGSRSGVRSQPDSHDRPIANRVQPNRVRNASNTARLRDISRSCCRENPFRSIAASAHRPRWS